MKTEYSNECPIHWGNITKEESILVISFSQETIMQPALNYYSNQNTFDDAFKFNNKCPQTQNKYFVSLSLLSLTDDQLKSLEVKNKTPEQNRVLEQNPALKDLQTGVLDEDATRAIIDPVRRYIEKIVKIQAILDRFDTKNSSIGTHHKKAKEVAEQLREGVNNLMLECISKMPTEDKLKTFVEKTQNLINNAMPVLERDLGWGDYLANFFKEICNAVRKVASLFLCGGFFNIYKPEAVIIVEKLKDEIYLLAPNK